MKLTHLAVYLIFATVGAKKFDQWSLGDIELFLSDRGVNFDVKDKRDELVALAEEEFNKLKKETSEGLSIVGETVQNILNYVTGQQKAPLTWDYLVSGISDTAEDASDSIKSWVFDSWNKIELEKFLKENGVKYKKKAQKSDLVALAKEHYDEIANKFGLSGYYPGSWLYDSWSIDDLKKWLSENDLTYDDAKDTKDELIKKVKEYNYLASLEIQDSKKSLFDALLLGELDIFDKSNKVKQDFIDSWSYSQLREWLYYQGLIDTKPGVKVDNLDKDKLKSIVLSNQQYLVDDINSWSEQAAKTASPYLEKGADAIKDAKENVEEVINDTFLIGVEKWDKSRLKSFLEGRDIPVPKFSTHKSLVNLVKEHINSPLSNRRTDSVGSWFYENLSTQSIRDWLKKGGKNVEGSREELIKQLDDLVNSGQEINENVQKEISEQITSFKPNLEAYKLYATKAIQDANKESKDNYEKVKAAAKEAKDDTYEKYDETTSLAEEALLDSYKLASEYYETAAKLIGSKVGTNSAKLKEALNEANKASYEYAASFAKSVSDKYLETTPKLEQSLKSAQVEGTSYANYVIDVVSSKIDDVQENGQAAGAALSAFWDQANAYFYKFIQPKANDIHSSATDAAGDFYAQATDKVAEFASNAQEAVQNAYGETKTPNEYVDIAQEHLNTAYNSVTNGWTSFWTRLSDSDIKAYLRSFGYSSKFLNTINHEQLTRLAQEQTNFYFGSSNVWDKPITEVISEKLGFGKKKSTLDRIKESVQF